MKRLTLLLIFILVCTGLIPILAQDEPEATETPDVAGWRLYVNNLIGFQMMLPIEWSIRDFGTTIEVYAVPNDPATTQLHISLTPVDFFNGGTIDGTAVTDLSLQDYASMALSYELGGPGTLSLKSVDPFQTDAGQEGYVATWNFAMTPLDEAGGTVTPGETENQLLTAVYFDLETPDINGQVYRALEITLSGLPDETLNTVLKSVVTSGLETDDAFFSGLEEAVNVYLDTQGSTVSEVSVQPQIVDGDYVRFSLVTTDEAESDAALGFAQRAGDGWQVIAVDTAFTPEFFTQNVLPTSLQPVIGS